MVNKRSFFPVALLVILSMALAACAPTTVVQTVEVPVNVEVTRVVDGAPQVVMITPTPEPVKAASAENPIELRIGVSMTPVEMETFLPLLDKIDQAHPEWILVVEQTPQSSVTEKLNANAAAGSLPDIQELVGVPDIIYKGVLLPLDDYIAASSVDMTDFWPGVPSMYTFNDSLYGLPFTSAPELLYYNIDMFDAAGLDYPTNEWTFDQLKEAAIKLTLDSKGRNAADPNFDPNDIKQWGFNTNPGSLSTWASPVYIKPWGGDFCADPGCTQVSMTDAADLEALNWWHDLVVVKHAALSDPYSGAQTGVPGDPFVSGFTAMGFNGYFAVGQIKAMGSFDFGIVQPPAGPKGHGTAFSARAYGIAANSLYPDEAWKLIQELTSSEFLADMWAKPGHSVPARRSAAQALLQVAPPPADMSGVLLACEYGEGFRPMGPGSFEALIKTMATSGKVFSGEITVEEGYALMNTEANDILKQAAGQ